MVDSSSSWSPVDEYQRRQRLHEKRVAELEARHVLLGYCKLVVIVAIVVTAWLWHSQRVSSSWFIGIPVCLYIGVAIYHSRVLRKQATAQRAVEIYIKGLARIEDLWPRDLEHALPADRISSSLYAKDLDIVGKGSLFELLCVARTRMGEHCLLNWLLNPASLETIYQRQEAIAELRHQLDFRERMVIAGESISIGVKPEVLKQWAQAASPLAAGWVRWLAAGLALFTIGAAVIWLKDRIVSPFLVLLLVDGGVARLLNKQMSMVFTGIDAAFQNLQLVSSLLIEIERQSFASPYLQAVQQQLLSQQTTASDAIASLGTLISYKDALSNPVLAVLNRPLLYSVQLAFAIQGWRERYGVRLSAWLDALGEIEALLSLAGYSYEHPDDPFPTFTDGPAFFEAQELGHPLIPAAKCVCNSVTIGRPAKLLLISGSNMSGKSTLMRTVGINTVLALCGAPVRAKQMLLTPLRLGASLVVNDSLQRGASRFYAEIEKLQQICSLAQQQGSPVLFLLDELLQGTNSVDRRIGAEGITRELLQAGAIGILTTHDLSLTEIDNGDGNLKNMHFQDAIVEGKMQFDFQLRDGIVTRSNGVELMRLIGLKV